MKFFVIEEKSVEGNLFLSEKTIASNPYKDDVMKFTKKRRCRKIHFEKLR